MSIRFDGRTVIVTGAGNGLGRSHALSFAERGAKVVVNDVGGTRHGEGQSMQAADEVVETIRSAGGTAMSNSADVTDPAQVQALVDEVISTWGTIDVLINNAGILRDKSFGKMSTEEWDAVIKVHLNGSAYMTRAVWPHMREQGYGRVVLTTSTSGIYGNFGQSNYGAAKTGMLGLMNVLCIEGLKYNVRINCICPTAATRMTEDVIDPAMLKWLEPKHVTPAVLFLASDDAPNQTIMLAGAGSYSIAQLHESEGIYLDEAERTPDHIAARYAQVSDMSGSVPVATGHDHVVRILERAAKNQPKK